MTKVVMTVEVEINNEALLRAFAQKRYVECWGDTGVIASDDVGRAVCEALVCSNLNPPSEEYGITISKLSYDVEPEAASS